MGLNTSGVVRKIIALAAVHRRALCTVALVGSSSPLHKEEVAPYSDVDLVILEEDGSAWNYFLEQLRETIDQNWKICTTWHIVSPAFVGAPIIHVHGAHVSAYLRSSSLFRRSVAKYPSLVGPSLSLHAPKTPISREELLYDRLGVLSLLDRLDGSKPHSGFALEVDEPRCYSSLLDVSIYCVLHSVRNSLRWLGRYEEFSRTEELAKMWSAVRGGRADILDRFLESKVRPAKRKFVSEDDETTSARRLQGFLTPRSLSGF